MLSSPTDHIGFFGNHCLEWKVLDGAFRKFRKVIR